MSKTKSMVFRNGGIIEQNEVLYFDGQKLENVSYYKYLGLTMSTRLSWSPAQVTLAAQASKALNIINQVNYNCNYSFKAACDIFDKCVLPVVSYGSEIWGTDVHKTIENVHLKFCKKPVRCWKQDSYASCIRWMWNRTYMCRMYYKKCEILVKNYLLTCWIIVRIMLCTKL